MELYAKLYNKEEDYHDVQKWALTIGQMLIEDQCLPGVGCIIYDKAGKKYGCGFLYLDNETPVAVLEWVFVNPECTAKEKVATIKVILDVMERGAIAEEKPLMYASSSSDGLTRLYERAGWTVTARNVCHLIKNTQDKE